MAAHDSVPDKQAAQEQELSAVSNKDDSCSAGKKGKAKHFDIDIFRAWCKSCGICAAFCPKHCIQLDEEGAPTISDTDECSGCGWCELHCPDFAISVHPRQDSAKTSEEQD